MTPAKAQAVGITEIAVANTSTHPFNARRELGAIEELVESVKRHGVLEPVLATAKDGGFLVVAGRRRLEAAARAGLKTIPAIVRELTDAEAAAIALEENLKREDLTALEEAQTLRQLLELTGATQRELAARVGRSQPWVANKLRLLELPDPVQDALIRGRIDEGHAAEVLALVDASLAGKLTLANVTRDQVRHQVAEVNAWWRGEGPGAVAAAKVALEKAQAQRGIRVVTWRAGAPAWRRLDLAKGLGKPPATIAGVVGEDVTPPRHDKGCTCRALELVQAEEDRFDTRRVCVVPGAWRSLARGASTSAGLRNRAVRARELAAVLREVRARVDRALNPPAPAPLEPIRRRLTVGGLDGEAARLVAFVLARRDVYGARAELELWQRLRALTLPRVQRVILAQAADDFDDFGRERVIRGVAREVLAFYRVKRNGAPPRAPSRRVGRPRKVRRRRVAA